MKFNPPEVRFKICYITCECGFPLKGVVWWQHNPNGDKCKPCKPKYRAWTTVKMQITLEEVKHAQLYFEPVVSDDKVFQQGATRQVIELKEGTNIVNLMVMFSPPSEGYWEEDLKYAWNNEEWDTDRWPKDKNGFGEVNRYIGFTTR